MACHRQSSPVTWIHHAEIAPVSESSLMAVNAVPWHDVRTVRQDFVRPAIFFGCFHLRECERVLSRFSEAAHRAYPPDFKQHSLQHLVHKLTAISSMTTSAGDRLRAQVCAPPHRVILHWRSVERCTGLAWNGVRCSVQYAPIRCRHMPRSSRNSLGLRISETLRVSWKGMHNEHSEN